MFVVKIVGEKRTGIYSKRNLKNPNNYYYQYLCSYIKGGGNNEIYYIFRKNIAITADWRLTFAQVSPFTDIDEPEAQRKIQILAD